MHDWRNSRNSSEFIHGVNRSLRPRRGRTDALVRNTEPAAVHCPAVREFIRCARATDDRYRDAAPFDAIELVQHSDFSDSARQFEVHPR